MHILYIRTHKHVYDYMWVYHKRVLRCIQEKNVLQCIQNKCASYGLKERRDCECVKSNIHKYIYMYTNTYISIHMFACT